MTKDELKALWVKVFNLCDDVREASASIHSRAFDLETGFEEDGYIYLNEELAWIKEDIATLQTAIRTLEDEIKDKMATPNEFSIRYLLENEENKNEM